jgi:predicted PurR-regulated permease PerM
MSSVEFEEEAPSTFVDTKRESTIVRFLKRHGIIKNTKIAMAFVVVFCLLAIGFSIFLFSRSNQSSRPMPYSDVPSSVKDNLPLSVQNLYSIQNN